MTFSTNFILSHFPSPSINLLLCRVCLAPSAGRLFLFFLFRLFLLFFIYFEKGEEMRGGGRIKEGGRRARKMRSIYRHFSVFHFAQCERKKIKLTPLPTLNSCNTAPALVAVSRCACMLYCIGPFANNQIWPPFGLISLFANGPFRLLCTLLLLLCFVLCFCCVWFIFFFFTTLRCVVCWVVHFFVPGTFNLHPPFIFLQHTKYTTTQVTYPK
jgi:hypothetical protein